MARPLNGANIRTTGSMDIIPWSPNYPPLTWSDFEAEANPASFEDAFSFVCYRPTWVVISVLGSEYDAKVRDDAGREPSDGGGPGGGSDDYDDDVFFMIDQLLVTTEFWPSLSWTRSSQDDALLNHQQGHFDLGELVMRREIDGIRKSLLGRRFPTRGKNKDQREQFAKEDSALLIRPAITSLEKALEAAQAKYDQETGHGEILEEQSRYDGEFAALRA